MYFLVLISFFNCIIFFRWVIFNDWKVVLLEKFFKEFGYLYLYK